jgi:hypothetical protein
VSLKTATSIRFLPVSSENWIPLVPLLNRGEPARTDLRRKRFSLPETKFTRPCWIQGPPFNPYGGSRNLPEKPKPLFYPKKEFQNLLEKPKPLFSPEVEFRNLREKPKP